MRLSTQYSLFAAGLVGAVVLGVSGVLLISEGRRLRDRAEEERARLLSAANQIAREATETSDDLLLVDTLAHFRQTTPELLGAVYLDQDGRMISPDLPGPARALADLEPGRDASLDAEPVDILDARVLGPRGAEGPLLGTVRLAFSRRVQAARVAHERGQLAAQIGGIAAVVFLIGLGAALACARFITAPIERLARGVRDIGRGRLDTRLATDGPEEIASLAEDLSRMAERIRKLDELKSDFVSSVSHELRSPLTAVEGYADLLLEKIQGGRADVRQLVKALLIIRNDTSRLRRFIDDILDVARIEAGQMSARRAPVDVGAVIEGVRELYEPLFREKRLAVSWRPPAHLPRAHGDEDHLRHVLSNLISNAIKFTPEGGRIVIAAEERAGVVDIEVTDSGPGLPPEAYKIIFEKFRQWPAGSAHPKGSGLGLAIAKGLMASQGGDIWVESALGHGCTFTVALPIAPAAPVHAIMEP